MSQRSSEGLFETLVRVLHDRPARAVFICFLARPRPALPSSKGEESLGLGGGPEPGTPPIRSDEEVWAPPPGRGSQPRDRAQVPERVRERGRRAAEGGIWRSVGSRSAAWDRAPDRVGWRPAQARPCLQARGGLNVTHSWPGIISKNLGSGSSLVLAQSGLLQ